MAKKKNKSTDKTKDETKKDKYYPTISKTWPSLEGAIKSMIDNTIRAALHPHVVGAIFGKRDDPVNIDEIERVLSELRVSGIPISEIISKSENVLKSIKKTVS